MIPVMSFDEPLDLEWCHADTFELAQEEIQVAAQYIEESIEIRSALHVRSAPRLERRRVKAQGKDAYTSAKKGPGQPSEVSKREPLGGKVKPVEEPETRENAWKPRPARRGSGGPRVEPIASAVEEPHEGTGGGDAEDTSPASEPVGMTGKTRVVWSTFVREIECWTSAQVDRKTELLEDGGGVWAKAVTARLVDDGLPSERCFDLVHESLELGALEVVGQIAGERIAAVYLFLDGR
jgi:hypothetical protein